jgi:hypothetical protein
MHNLSGLGSAETAIGSAFRNNPSRRFLPVGIALSVVTIDLTLGVKFIDPVFRTSYALVGIGLLFLLAGGDQKSLGLTLKSKQNLRYWFRATTAAGLIGAVIFAIAAVIITLSGGEIIRGEIPDARAFLFFHHGL